MRLLLLLLLAGCGRSLSLVDDEQPCFEARTAIARRTEQCTGDRELANERYDAFDDDWRCIPTPTDDRKLAPIAPDLYGCAAAITSLSCDEALDFGDDLELWLTVDPACGYVVELKE